MALIETGQPEFIDRAQLMLMLESVGLDPMKIHPDGVHISGHAIRCRVISEGPDGRPLMSTEEPNALAWNEIHIPVLPALGD